MRKVRNWIFLIFIASVSFEANAYFLKNISETYYQRNQDKFKISFRDEYYESTNSNDKKTSNFTSYPDLKFYSSPTHKNDVVLEINSKGLFHKGKLIYKPENYNSNIFFGPDDFYKFHINSGISSGPMYSYFEFDRFVNDSIIEASYKNEKIYLDLNTINDYEKVKFNLEEGIPEYKRPREPGELAKVYWIERPRNHLYSEFLNKHEGAKVFIKEITTCLDKDGAKCLKENINSDTLYRFFDVIYSNTLLYVEKESSIGDWVYESPSLYETVKECLTDGDIVTLTEIEKKDLVKKTVHQYYSITLKSRRNWSLIDGSSAGWLFCQIVGGKEFINDKFQQVSKPKLYITPPPVD